MVKYIAIILLVLLLLSGCEDFTSGPRFEGDVYAIAGLLKAGKAINAEHPVYLTRSADIESFDPMDIFVMEADIQIIELDTGKSWSLSPILDTQEYKVKWIDPAANIIQPEHSYRIQVQVPGYDQVISAETTVPVQTILNPDYYQHNVEGEGYSLDEDSMGEVVFDVADIRYPLALNTLDRAQTFNLLIDLYCLEPFSTELEFTTPIFGLTHPREDMEDVYNGSGNGFRRISSVGRVSSAVQPEYEDNYILLKDYRQAFIFYGRYLVSTYIVDENFYRYTYMSEGYLYGGVQNALGYFGSASGGVMYVKVIKAPL
ncbi:MAG: DUF4249 family protein [Candidatus Cloacimonadaceae bacterium]|jgi:hypothetical protein|nr:DUF4249 family protein [Candidatus Cloacimonadota bacterium]MDY0127991.1 DUF4249 family protein [Candidatus Cloacimonadaceae bacterium]MCB5255345.1 DUF4249 family protein [Candidatus Cloacimonadota bacterium]MCK9178232.1 DUF4249 family protein [Candidatus Cloacimonadota bacterium]MCK9242230.1 DUF4249 family protein [Candidatus Cloacimonadota bacterium]